MGQAWCKERTTKAQDSKSPLDRVFVRCAHQIYPTLKQDGSVLGGGATQRVTSSEIGYAGSPPREALTRGESVDSIDRPFHPSEWVDVNLEVPSTPSSVITNLTANTSLYQTTTLSSTGSNLKNITPIPPPRRRRKNRGRPLPPKPDEIIKTHGNVKKIEPLYSSVKSTKLKEAELQVLKKKSNDGTKNDEKKDREKIETKEVNENKVNGTGRVLAITKVTEGDRWTSFNPGEAEEQRAHHQNQEKYHDHKNPNKNKNKNNNNNEERDIVVDKKRNNQDLEYEKFSKSQELRSSSTPNGPAKNSERRELSTGKDLREFLTRTIIDDDDILDNVHHRPKNYSTVSLPNYDELEVVKKEVEREVEAEELELVTPKKPGRGRNVSTASLPTKEMLTSLPQETTDRLEKYMTRCRSFGSLSPHEIMDKLKAHGEQIDSSDEDEWGELDDWDLGVFDHSQPSDGRSPLEPSSRLRERKVAVTPKFNIGETDVVITKKDQATVDIAKESHQSDNDKSAKNETQITETEKKTLSIPRNASFEIPKSPNSLKSALKVEANRKISMPAKFASDKPSSPLEDWFSAQERSVRFFDVPKLEEEYANTPGHRPVKPSEVRKPEVEYDTRSYPFNGMPTGPIDIDTFFEVSQDFGGTKNSSDSSGRQERPKNLTRSLSNESEPFDGYEEKELTLDIRSQHSSIGKLSRTISDESIPPEMTVEGVALSNVNPTTKSHDSKTPPPSPEPKIHAEIVGNENLSGGRPTGVKIQRDDGGESNLSSMTPSLTELEAALSDMLEKEDQDELRVDNEHVEDSEDSNLRHSETSHSLDKPIEPKILPKPIEREKSMGNDTNPEEVTKDSNLFVRRRKENVKISLGQILNNPDGNIEAEISLTKELSPELKILSEKGGKVKDDKIPGRNPFDDTDDDDEDEDNEARKGFDIPKTASTGSRPLNPFDGEPPEKPSRLHKIPLDDSSQEIPDVPRPPQRKNKQGAISPTIKIPTLNIDSEFPIMDSSPHPNDRLI